MARKPPPPPPFPWGYWSADSSDRSLKSATSKKARSRDVQSRTVYKSKYPAVIIGSFRLVDADKMVEITTKSAPARPNPFKIHAAAAVQRALKLPGKKNKSRQAANYGMALVQWKKKNGTDATVTWYRPFHNLKLNTPLSKQQGQDIYGRWTQ